MKKIVLAVYNYGRITKIASFDNCAHDATKCMQFMNDDLIKAHGKLPDNIFYFLSYEIKLRHCYFVNWTSGPLWPNEQNPYINNLNRILAENNFQRTF